MGMSHDAVGRSVHVWNSNDWTLRKHITVRLFLVAIGDLPRRGSAEWLWDPSIGGKDFGLTLCRSGL